MVAHKSCGPGVVNQPGLTCIIKGQALVARAGNFSSGLQDRLALGFLVVFGSMVAYTASAYLIQNTRPAIATSFAYVNPVIALLLGGWLAGEHLPLKGWLAVAMIIGAVALVVLKPLGQPGQKK